MDVIEPMAHRRVSGKILYTSNKPQFAGLQRGQEWFAFTHHGDGAVTFRAHCEIWDPKPTVLRDIIYSLDHRGLPADCHVRLRVGDSFMGSGWFRFDLDDAGSGTIECESFGPSIGRWSERVETKGRFDGFGTHPIVGDAYLTRCMDIAQGPHRKRVRCFLPSPDHRGATPPKLAEVFIDLEYVGDDTVHVPAGTFAARHFRFIDESETGMGGTHHPVYDVWVSADSDALFLKGGVGGYMQTWYELVELER